MDILYPYPEVIQVTEAVCNHNASSPHSSVTAVLNGFEAIRWEEHAVFYLTNLMEPRVVKVCINDGIILEKENCFIRVQVLNNAVDAQVVPEFKALWCTPKVVHLVRSSIKRVLQLLSVSEPII